MKRIPEIAIQELLLNRWSPRAMDGTALTEEELRRLLEAAKWAPSSYNNQPWRFVYALQGDQFFAKFVDLMVPFNQSWAKNAGALFIILARKNFEYNGKPSRTHAFDTGAAAENLALQAFADGLVCHGMEGFDYDKAAALVGANDEYDVMAIFAVGHHAAIAVLPAELQERETPSDRKKQVDIAFHGKLQ
ncbi:nitroreductase family protein [Candidatus Dependentiae bacterium]|nr:nitroreductase family protein [Candidatus Dependentiae bacterium]